MRPWTLSIKPNLKRRLGRVHVLWPFASCKSRYTVAQEGEISSDFFHSKLAGFGPGNCYLTFRAPDLLNTCEHVLLKDYTTGFIAFIFASQFKKKKKIRMPHSPTETQCLTLFYTFIILYTTFSRTQKISILAYRYIGRRLVAEVSAACSNYSRNEVQATI